MKQNFLYVSSKVFLVLLIFETSRVVLSDHLGDNSHRPRAAFKGAQKVTAVFFGCSPLTPVTAKVTCKSKIDKLIKGVNCSVKVPLGTKATFTCPDNYTMKENYQTIQCRFPGKWTNTPVTCLPPDETTTASTTTKATTAAEIAPTSTTKAAAVATTTTTNKTSSKPLLLPIATKYYDKVGNVSLFNITFTQETARNSCIAIGSELLLIDNQLTKDAANDMWSTHLPNATFFWTDPTFDLKDWRFESSAGALFSGPWCPPDEGTGLNKTPCVQYDPRDSGGCNFDTICTFKRPFLCNDIP